MIDEIVEIRAQQFVVASRELLKDQYKSELNFTWTSISLLDLIFVKHLESGYGSRSTELILDITAYIGVCIYRIWEKSFLVKPKLKIQEKPNISLVLKLENGPFLKDDFIEIDLLQAFTELIFGKMEYAKNNSIPYGLEKFKIEYFVNGVTAGLSPTLKGVWKEMDLREMSIIFVSLVETMSEDSIIPMHLKHPDKADIFKMELFNTHLVFPPLGFDEELIGIRSILNLADSFRKLDYKRDDIVTLASILFESSSILQVAIGYILLYSFKIDGYRDLLMEFAASNPILCFRLKPACDAFCLEYQKENKWSDLSKSMNEELIEKSYAALTRTIEYGQNPLFHCADLKQTSNKKYRLYYENIDLGLIKEAFYLGEILCIEKDKIILMQQCSLALNLGKMNRSKELIESIDMPALNQVELEFYLFLQASIAVALNQVERLKKLFNVVLTSTSLSTLKRKLFFIDSLKVLHSNNEKIPNFDETSVDFFTSISIKFIEEHYKNEDFDFVNYLSSIKQAKWLEINLFNH